MVPLDKVIKDKFIPALFGTPLTQSERNLFSLPVRCGGLSIPIFTEKAASDFEAPVTITAPLATIMMQQLDKLSDMCQTSKI